MNKRYLQIVILLLLSAVTFSCSKKEGKISAKHRLDNVVAIESRYIGNEQIYTTGTYSSEDWHWDGNEAYRIDYGGPGAYSEIFFYDNRHRIAKTTVPAFGIVSEFHYDGRMLEHVDYLKDGSLFSTVSFVHDDEQLTEIIRTTFVADSVVSRISSSLISSFWGRCDVGQLAQQTRRTNSPKQTQTEHFQLTWSNNNVVAIRCSDGVEAYDISVTYDDKKNPYSQLFGYHDMNIEVGNFKMMSENNITRIVMPYKNYGNTTFDFKYVYDDEDYPSQRTMSYSFPVINTDTWEEVSARCEFTETYSYLK